PPYSRTNAKADPKMGSGTENASSFQDTLFDIAAIYFSPLVPGFFLRPKFGTSPAPFSPIYDLRLTPRQRLRV
ncbi:hypothetical protein, partial [Litorimonas sp.]|uniref:hypothetical protein n=1 Tax=Litorimonas sp. TaxID=1892381 RepID=UPI003A8AFD04